MWDPCPSISNVSGVALDRESNGILNGGGVPTSQVYEIT
jgi:hypothetical protein